MLPPDRAYLAGMPVYGWIITALWLVLVAYWAIAAAGAKRSVGGRAWRLEIGLRIALLALVLIAVRLPIARHAWRNAHAHALNTSAALGAAGVVLCALGVGLALWARVYLGRNWGLPMTRKEQPELVTHGPYAFARHPIYGGILLAAAGSAVGQSPFWLAALVLFGAYFLYSARREETLMLEQFPQAYPAYRRRTRMFVPFVV